MRVLITTPTYPPFNSGLGNSVQNQARIISALGHSVSIATSGKSKTVYLDQDADAMIYMFEITGAKFIARPIIGEIEAYVKFIKESEFDLIILNSWQNWATDLVLQYGGATKSKIFVYSHCISTNTIYPSDLFRSIARYILWRPYWWGLSKSIKKINGVIFLSSSGCDSRFDDLQLARKLNKYTTVIPNVVSSYAEELMESGAFPIDGRNQIISVGSYDWFKGHDFSIKAYAHSNYKNNTVLKIFGQSFTEYTNQLRLLASKLGISTEFIQFHQGVSGADLMLEYSKSFLLLNGSHSECQPLVLLDAMAIGLPFISRRSGAIPNLKGGVCVRKAEQAGNVMNALKEDLNKWKDLSCAGRLYAIENHKKNSILKEFHKFLEYAMSQ